MLTGISRRSPGSRFTTEDAEIAEGSGGRVFKVAKGRFRQYQIAHSPACRRKL
jgi:hypothetical protein